jgi:mono/diheme cytochrome c family protein
MVPVPPDVECGVAVRRREVTSVTGRAPVTAVLASAVFVVLLTACGGGGEGAAPASPPKPTGALAGDVTLLEGRRVYARYCASCHGVAGEGAPAPALIRGRLLRVLPDPAAELALLRKGGAVMPSFGGTLSDAELDAVVRYTREVLAPRD